MLALTQEEKERINAMLQSAGLHVAGGSVTDGKLWLMLSRDSISPQYAQKLKTWLAGAFTFDALVLNGRVV